MKRLSSTKFERFLNNLYGNQAGTKIKQNDPQKFGELFDEFREGMKTV